jgi:hypothetical protein
MILSVPNTDGRDIAVAKSKTRFCQFWSDMMIKTVDEWKQFRHECCWMFDSSARGTLIGFCIGRNTVPFSFPPIMSRMAPNSVLLQIAVRTPAAVAMRAA